MTPRFIRATPRMPDPDWDIGDNPKYADIEPTDEVLDWRDEDDIPVNIYGETDDA